MHGPIALIMQVRSHEGRQFPVRCGQSGLYGCGADRGRFLCLCAVKDADWDIVHNVHLRGVYKITQAAWKEMIKNKCRH